MSTFPVTGVSLGGSISVDCRHYACFCQSVVCHFWLQRPLVNPSPDGDSRVSLSACDVLDHVPFLVHSCVLSFGALCPPLSGVVVLVPLLASLPALGGLRASRFRKCSPPVVMVVEKQPS
jgi:hypothetical protein